MMCLRKECGWGRVCLCACVCVHVHVLPISIGALVRVGKLRKQRTDMALNMYCLSVCK